MWNSIHKFGFTKEDIDNICKDLLEKEEIREHCPDCGVKVNEPHDEFCDVARCSICGGQRLSCGCEEESEDIWEGYWPGTKDCLEQQLICCWDDSKEWVADLNELARRRM